ncbi:hypothetical protein A3J77_00355 [Candidatus Wolfebacteria bacterium RBG_13_41_7]|uniref:Photosynthesis system II assembly factor Ycf48/Hcf136-like domain-containing protein n=1 Tax=Candidatus Wolfebacteria bacterium RBG_13_41_7 TaxID=1802554 RepID=A0A1F8DRH0_9BACT|nr:MAG: hypothetical protein A3J77_00355 [Candidatus Wolfebacteria bacterium RBG_13_41_7]
MEIKDFGFLAVLIVWGGLFYLLSASFVVPNVSIGNEGFSAVALSAFSGFNGGGGSNESFGFVDESGEFQESQAYFKDSVDISQIEISLLDSSLLFAASDRGLFVSKDAGLNWYSFSDVEHKLNSNTAVYKILFNPENKKESFISVFSNGKGTIYRSENNFFSLGKLIEFDSEGAYDFNIKNNNLYLGLSNGKLMIYSIDKNESRILTTFSSPITGLKISPGGNLIYLTLKSGGLYLSYDGGQSFNRLKYLDNYNGANKINGFFISPLDGYLVYAATDYGLIRSFDAGATWKVFKSFPSETASVSVVALNDKGEIFTASNGKIYKSRDSGQNWQIIETNLGTQISAIVFSENRVIVGAGGS